MTMKQNLMWAAGGLVVGGYLYNRYLAAEVKKIAPWMPNLSPAQMAHNYRQVVNENTTLRQSTNRLMQELANKKYPDWAARQQRYGAMPVNAHVAERQRKYGAMEAGRSTNVPEAGAFGMIGINPSYAGAPSGARQRRFGSMSAVPYVEQMGFQRDTIVPLSAAQTSFGMK